MGLEKIKIILLTGFEPFRDFIRNSSYDSIKVLHNKTVKGTKIVVEKLPVSYKSAGRLLEQYIKKYVPKIVISFGMGTQYIQFECIALNINYSTTKDNDGLIIKKEQIIKKDGAIAYKSTLPYDDIATALKKHNIPIVKSFFAGTYLCNNIFYHLMYYAKKYGITTAGFIHVPPTPECFKNNSVGKQKIKKNFTTSKIAPSYSCINYPAITLPTLKTAVEIIVKTCV